MSTWILTWHVDFVHADITDSISGERFIRDLDGDAARAIVDAHNADQLEADAGITILRCHINHPGPWRVGSTSVTGWVEVITDEMVQVAIMGGQSQAEALVDLHNQAAPRVSEGATQAGNPTWLVQRDIGEGYTETAFFLVGKQDAVTDYIQLLNSALADHPSVRPLRLCRVDRRLIIDEDFVRVVREEWTHLKDLQARSRDITNELGNLNRRFIDRGAC